jgi:hypothetical protein
MIAAGLMRRGTVERCDGKVPGRVRCLLFLSGALAVLSACQSELEPADTEGPNFFSASDDVLRLAPDPALVVGLDEALPFDRVRSAVFVHDGVAIADNGSSEVLILDGAGKLVVRQGRQGSGPGEYRNLQGVARYGTGLVTWDTFHLRLARLDSSGRYTGGSTTPIPIPPWHYPTMVGAFGNGVLLRADPLGFMGDGPVGPMEVRQDVHFVIADASTGEVTFRTSLPGQEQWAARIDRSHGGPPVSFGRTVASAVTESGIYLADTDSLAFTRYDEAGNSVRFAFEHQRVDAVEEWETIVKDTLRARARSDFSLDLLNGLPARSTLPAFSEMIGGADGHLWVREYPDPLQDEVVWLALDEDFKLQKRIVIPAALRVVDLAEDRVLVLGKGAWGEDVIEVYMITRGNP